MYMKMRDYKIIFILLSVMKKQFYLLLLLLMLFASCQSKRALVASDVQNRTGSVLQLKKSDGRVKLYLPDTLLVTSFKKGVSSHYKGISRIRNYHFYHRDVPKEFDGFRIAFISDLHYKSLFKEKGLNSLVRLLNDEHVDALLLGGDYQEGCEYVRPLISALAKVNTTKGIYAVMGNNDYERCHELIIDEMQRNGIHVLEHKVDTLRRNGQQIIIAGVRNPFDLKENGKSPTLGLSPTDFVILLTHTPDYAEDVPITYTDLVLAGHTHGGQITLFGYAPVLPSHYGQRFRTGLKTNSSHIPLIITNGIGTSRKNMRLFAPSEVVIIELHNSRLP